MGWTPLQEAVQREMAKEMKRPSSSLRRVEGEGRCPLPWHWTSAWRSTPDDGRPETEAENTEKMGASFLHPHEADNDDDKEDATPASPSFADVAFPLLFFCGGVLLGCFSCAAFFLSTNPKETCGTTTTPKRRSQTTVRQKREREYPPHTDHERYS